MLGLKPRLSGRTASAFTLLSHGSRPSFKFLKTNKFYQVLKLDVVGHTIQHSRNGGRIITEFKDSFGYTAKMRGQPGIYNTLTQHPNSKGLFVILRIPKSQSGWSRPFLGSGTGLSVYGGNLRWLFAQITLLPSPSFTRGKCSASQGRSHSTDIIFQLQGSNV